MYTLPMGKLFMHFVPQYIFECYYDDLAYEQKKRAIPGRIFLIVIYIVPDQGIWSRSVADVLLVLIGLQIFRP